MGADLPARRHRHVPGAVPRHAGARLPELPVADPPGGEAQVPAGAGAPHGRDHRHREDAAGDGPARRDGRRGRDRGRAALRHGERGRHGRRLLRAEREHDVRRPGPDPGPLSPLHRPSPLARRRRPDHAAVLGRGPGECGDRPAHREHPGLRAAGRGRGRAHGADEARLGRGGLRVRRPPHPVRDVLRGRQIRHHDALLQALRLDRVGPYPGGAAGRHRRGRAAEAGGRAGEGA